MTTFHEDVYNRTMAKLASVNVPASQMTKEAMSLAQLKQLAMENPAIASALAGGGIGALGGAAHGMYQGQGHTLRDMAIGGAGGAVLGGALGYGGNKLYNAGMTAGNAAGEAAGYERGLNAHNPSGMVSGVDDTNGLYDAMYDPSNVYESLKTTGTTLRGNQVGPLQTPDVIHGYSGQKLLPAPRVRGNINNIQTPDVIYAAPPIADQANLSALQQAQLAGKKIIRTGKTQVPSNYRAAQQKFSSVNRNAIKQMIREVLAGY